MTKVPDWFEGEVYTEGSLVENPFSGECCELNNVEVSIYDFIMGANLFAEAYPEVFFPDDDARHKIYSDMRKGLDWFRQNNPEAYMILLD